MSPDPTLVGPEKEGVQGKTQELPVAGHNFPSLCWKDTVVDWPEPLLKYQQQALYLCVLATVAHWEAGGDSHPLPTLSLLPGPC